MDAMWKSLFLYDQGVCCQVNQHNANVVKTQVIQEENCRCCELGISCRISDLSTSLHEQAKSLEDQSGDQIIDLGSTEDGDVQSSVGDVQSRAPEVEDAATNPDLPPRSMTFYNGCYRGRYKVLVLACAWYCLLVAANSTIVEIPQNTVILKGESPTTIDLTCRSDRRHRLVWFLNKNQSCVKEQLYNGYVLRPDVKHYCMVITDEPGKCYLNLINTAEAAQTYICFEPGTLNEASADIIWFGDLTCHDSSTEDLVTLTCSIEFRGNWAPTMEWKEYIYDEKVLSVGVNTVTVPNQRVTSTLVMPVQEGGRIYICTAKFDISGKPNTTTARNVPDFNRVWTFPVFIKSEGSIQDQANVLIIIIAVTAIVYCYWWGIYDSPSERRSGKCLRRSIDGVNVRCVRLVVARELQLTLTSGLPETRVNN